MQESLVNVKQSLIANGQSAVVVEPSQRTLNHPPVPAQSLAALHTSSGNPRRDAPLAQSTPAPLEVVPFVCMQFRRSLSSSSTKVLRLLDRSDCINNVGKRVRVVDVGWCADYSEGNSRSVDHKMALRARFSFIRRIRAGTLPPFLARTVAESTAARAQSILPASPNLSNSTWCSFSHTPASCQSRSLRQQVMPLPQPISGGSMSQWIPVLNTNKMPVSAARLGILGRPPLGFGGSGGNRGSITSHSSSVSIGFAIP